MFKRNSARSPAKAKGDRPVDLDDLDQDDDVSHFTTESNVSISSRRSLRNKYTGFIDNRRTKKKNRVALMQNKMASTPTTTRSASAAVISSASRTSTTPTTTKSASSPSSAAATPPTPTTAPTTTPNLESVTAALAFEAPASNTNNTSSKAKFPPTTSTVPSETSELQVTMERREINSDKNKDSSSSSKDQQQRTLLLQVDPDPPATNDLRSILQQKSSWLTRTKTFRKLCLQTFQNIDSDQSGDVDENELYSGLLLIHLKLGMYLGPSACRPLDRARCHKVFTKFDETGENALNLQEFENVMTVLFSNVLFRVLVQWSMTIIIVPIIAEYILQLFYQAVAFVYLCIINADEYSSMANNIELTIETVLDYILQNSMTMPNMMVVILNELHETWSSLPDSMWNAAPLALISTILGLLVAPFTIMKVDDFFQFLAERKSRKIMNNTNVDQEQVSPSMVVRDVVPTSAPSSSPTSTPAKEASESQDAALAGKMK